MKKILIGIIAIFIVIQFIHPQKNISAAPGGQHIEKLYLMSDSVKTVLQKACYDCHSNNTRYPWYNNIQPVAWWLRHHIDEGKDELNFSEFGTYKPKRQLKKLKEITHEVQEGDMPLDSYTWTHKDAILTDAEKNLVIDWATATARQIAAANPDIAQ